MKPGSIIVGWQDGGLPYRKIVREPWNSSMPVPEGYELKMSHGLPFDFFSIDDCWVWVGGWQLVSYPEKRERRESEGESE